MNRGEYARELAPGSQDSADVLALEPPPQIPPPATKAGWRSALRVLPMTVGGIAMGLMMLSQGHGMIAGLMGAVYALSMLAMVVASSARGGNSRAELDAARADYLAHLDQARRQLRQSHRDQCERMRSHHPAPSQLWTLIGTDQMWSRTRADPSFGSVRVGEGTQESAMRVVHDDWDASSVDPMSRNRALNLIESHRLFR